MKRYYDVCPQCGANLDPSEKCDCYKSKLNPETYVSGDCLIMGYDSSEGDMVTVLNIVRRNADDTLTVINTFTNDAARELYSILTTNNQTGGIK